MQVTVIANLYDNKAHADHAPQWEFKRKTKLTFDAGTMFLYQKEEAIEWLKELLSDKGNAWVKYEFDSLDIDLDKPEDITYKYDDFNKKSQLKKRNEILNLRT